MKRAKILVFIIVIPILIWLFALVKCEINTVLHGHELEHEYTQTQMIRESKATKAKVLKYTNTYAKVYYVDKEGGDVISFKKVKGQWIMDEWNTIWSQTGSADGFMWPYIR